MGRIYFSGSGTPLQSSIKTVSLNTSRRPSFKKKSKPKKEKSSKKTPIHIKEKLLIENGLLDDHTNLLTYLDERGIQRKVTYSDRVRLRLTFGLIRFPNLSFENEIVR